MASFSSSGKFLNADSMACLASWRLILFTSILTASLTSLSSPSSSLISKGVSLRSGVPSWIEDAQVISSSVGSIFLPSL